MLKQTSNPSKIVENLGGVGFNIVSVIKKLGNNVRFSTAIGNDHSGHVITTELKRMGLNTSNILKVLNTGQGNIVQF
eukprot:UN04679